LADCFVVVGTVLMMVHILFFEGKKSDPEVQADPNNPPESEGSQLIEDGQTGESN